MEHTRWIWATIALAGGLLFGEIAGRIARRGIAGRASASETHLGARREVAGLVGTIVFWSATATGLLLGVGILDSAVLEDLGEELGEVVPSLGIAALVLIVGHAISVLLAAMVGQSARRATGVRQRGLERGLRASVMATAIVVALAELGVNPVLIAVPLAAAIVAPALAFALLSGLGGRDVAGQIAAGRALRHQLREGRTLCCDGVEGRIVALHPTSVEIERGDGVRAHIPNRSVLTSTFSLTD